MHPNMGMSGNQLPCAHMHSRVMCLITSVCVRIYVHKNSDLVPYHSKYLTECNIVCLHLAPSNSDCPWEKSSICLLQCVRDVMFSLLLLAIWMAQLLKAFFVFFQFYIANDLGKPTAELLLQGHDIKSWSNESEFLRAVALKAPLICYD